MITRTIDYYTTWSNILFYTIFLLNFITDIPNDLVIATIVNMIMVGLAGNIIFATSLDKMSDDKNIDVKKCGNISLHNFLIHTIPMLIAVVWFIYASSKFNPWISASLIVGFILIWSIIPNQNGEVLIKKIKTEYGDPNFWVYLMIIAVIAGLLFLKTKI